MEEVMCLEGEQQYFERYLWFYRESAIIFMYICEEWDCYSSLTKITEGGLDNVVQRRENGSARLGSARLGSARLGSARQEHSAVFSACQVLFHTIYNEPVAGDRAHYALASAFCVCRKDGGLILKS